MTRASAERYADSAQTHVVQFERLIINTQPNLRMADHVLPETTKLAALHATILVTRQSKMQEKDQNQIFCKSKEMPRHPPMIRIGAYEVDTWYSSPYPQEYAMLNKLFICEFCLTYMASEETLTRHKNKCPLHCPPGNEIYRSSYQIKGRQRTLSVFEADGSKCKLYCQNLCLLAKMFLDHKTLFYDVEPFLFYILTQKVPGFGDCIVGYFSKEKHCVQKNNVSCLLVLPQYQGYGFGQLLIDFSYELSRQENCPGSPEKPLSDLGRMSYTNYWFNSILRVIKNKQQASIAEISKETFMTPNDIISTLETYRMLQKGGDKKTYSIYLYGTDLEKLSKKPHLSVRPEDLRWTKFISHYAKPCDDEEEAEQVEEDEEEAEDMEQVDDGNDSDSTIISNPTTTQECHQLSLRDSGCPGSPS